MNFGRSGLDPRLCVALLLVVAKSKRNELPEAFEEAAFRTLVLCSWLFLPMHFTASSCDLHPLAVCS